MSDSMKARIALSCTIFAISFTATTVMAQEPFSKLVGPVTVGPVQKTNALEVPFITWGGDVATFHANGGLDTKPGTIFEKHGLKLKLVPGDDFVGQVKNYLGGKTPFLRGTMSMIGQASEVIGADPRTKPVVFLQLTWSAGDHMVARENFRNLNEMKAKKFVLQRGGPHVGMLNDILQTPRLSWTDIQVVWADDLTGPKGPAELFRKDPTIDACFCISPDMAGLTGGLKEKGSGKEGTVKGAHVLVSTADLLARSIADVYACRKDFYDANKEQVEKFAAGYLKGCVELLDLKKSFKDKKPTPKYTQILKMTQQILGKEVIPTEEDADGLISDCTFVLLDGNESFFTDRGNLSGFEQKMDEVLKLAVALKNASKEFPFLHPSADYSKLATTAGVARTRPAVAGNGRSGGEVLSDEDIIAGTINSYTIFFEPDQRVFRQEQYSEDFERAIRQASTYGKAKIVIRGHSDPTKTLLDFVQAAVAKGVLKQIKMGDQFEYFMEGKKLDLTDTKKIVEIVKTMNFDGAQNNPLDTFEVAENLSNERASAVRDAVIKYAEMKKYLFDKSQIVSDGAGIVDPVIPKPKNLNEAKKNMRVEFRIVRVSGEVTSSFNF